MCLYVSSHIYICVQLYICVYSSCIPIYIQSHLRMCLYVSSHIYICVQLYICVYSSCVPIYIQSHLLMCLYVSSHIYICVQLYIYVYSSCVPTYIQSHLSSCKYMYIKPKLIGGWGFKVQTLRIEDLGTCIWIMSHMYGLCHICVSHPYEVLKHIHEACHILMRHVTNEPFMPHYEACHTDIVSLIGLFCKMNWQESPITRFWKKSWDLNSTP